MSEEPKPCPFCGDEAKEESWKMVEGSDLHHWFCTCGVSGPVVPGSKEALTAWNRLAVVPEEGGESFERLAEAVHDAWWWEKEKQGNADKHPDAIPYNRLPDHIKEYDRVIVRTVLEAMLSAAPDPQEGQE